MNTVAIRKITRVLAIPMVALFTLLAVWGFSGQVAADQPAESPFANSAVWTTTTQISDTVTTEIEPTAGETTAQTVLAPSASITLYMPFVSAGFTPLNLQSTTAQKDGDSYSWTLSWAGSQVWSGSYLLEESDSPTFSTSKTTYTVNDTSHKITHPAGTSNVYYYRVRFNDARAPQSNTVQVVSAYFNDFNSSIDSWQIVKEDFDETQNVLSRTDAGELKLHVQGRWDYMMASPLAPAPPPPYRITARIKFAGPGNLNTYGALLGADYQGGSCPQYTTTGDYVYSNCFNTYYRNVLLWNWGGDTMQSSVKKIYLHTADKNSGRGDTFIDFQTITLSDSNANGWNLWTWEVHADGTFKVLSGNNVRQTFNDTEFLHYPYWGFWASTDEYPGSDPLIDWVLVEPMN